MCTMLSVPVNAVLTPLMVRILNWGVAGASISTVLGSVASLIALIIVLKKGKRIIKLTVKKPSVEDFKEIEGSEVRKLLRNSSVGYPSY